MLCDSLPLKSLKPKESASPVANCLWHTLIWAETGVAHTVSLCELEKNASRLRCKSEGKMAWWTGHRLYFRLVLYSSSHIAFLVHVTDFTTVNHYYYSKGKLISKVREEMTKKMSNWAPKDIMSDSSRTWGSFQVTFKRNLRRRNKERLAESSKLMSVVEHQEHCWNRPAGPEWWMNDLFWHAFLWKSGIRGCLVRSTRLSHSPAFLGVYFNN